MIPKFEFMKLDLRSRSFVYNQVSSNFSLWLSLSRQRSPQKRTPAIGPVVAVAVVDKPECRGLGGSLGNLSEKCHSLGTNYLVCMSGKLEFADNINKVRYKYEKTFQGMYSRPRIGLGITHINLLLNNTFSSVLTRNNCVNVHRYLCVRNYASRKKRQVNKQPDDTDNESEEEDSDDSEFDTDDDYNENVDTLPKGWKDLVQVVPSLRLDTVLSAGLGIARKKVEDAFLLNKLRVNNERISKKSKTVKAGDVLDIIRDGEDKQDGNVMRVIVLKIASEKTSKDRIRVKLRRWKKLDPKSSPANS